jgi:hypothetical protein
MSPIAQTDSTFVSFAVNMRSSSIASITAQHSIAVLTLMLDGLVGNGVTVREPVQHLVNFIFQYLVDFLGVAPDQIGRCFTRQRQRNLARRNKVIFERVSDCRDRHILRLRDGVPQFDHLRRRNRLPRSRIRQHGFLIAFTSATRSDPPVMRQHRTAHDAQIVFLLARDDALVDVLGERHRADAEHIGANARAYLAD